MQRRPSDRQRTAEIPWVLTPLCRRHYLVSMTRGPDSTNLTSSVMDTSVTTVPTSHVAWTNRRTPRQLRRTRGRHVIVHVAWPRQHLGPTCQ